MVEEHVVNNGLSESPLSQIKLATDIEYSRSAPPVSSLGGKKYYSQADLIFFAHFDQIPVLIRLPRISTKAKRKHAENSVTCCQCCSMHAVPAESRKVTGTVPGRFSCWFVVQFGVLWAREWFNWKWIRRNFKLNNWSRFL